MVDSPVTNEFNTILSDAPFQRVVVTRLAPPAQQTRLLKRERVTTLLMGATDFPLTIIAAPAGCGKTTALATLTRQHAVSIAWCRMADETAFSFLCHMVAAFHHVGIIADSVPCKDILLGNGNETPAPLSIIELFINTVAPLLTTDVIVILDDYHKAEQRADIQAVLERLLAILPENLHVVLSTRYHPRLTPLETMRVRGELYYLEQDDIAFTVEEVHALFQLYEHTIFTDITHLTRFCNGWPLVLQLIVVTTGNGCNEDITDQLPEQTSELAHTRSDVLTTCLQTLAPMIDSYLLRHVLQEQPPELQQFLLYTASLRWFDADVCNALPSVAHVVPHYPEIVRRGLFLQSFHEGHIEYQAIFHMFLERHASATLTEWTTIHHEAAHYYHTHNEWESVLFHLLTIDAHDEAVAVLHLAACNWLQEGRAMMLLTWVQRFAETTQKTPAVREMCAAAYRQLGRFNDALAMYEAAAHAYEQTANHEGHARSLRGQAEVYLDTVQPSLAETLLEKAFALMPCNKRAERAEILLLQAENWANRGRADIAFAMEDEARQLAEEEQNINEATVQEGDYCPLSVSSYMHHATPSPLLRSRLLLRSGRLNESLELLEKLLHVPHKTRNEQPPSMLAHREPLLLLALLYAMLGNGTRAFAMAMRGLLEAMHGGSQFTEAIAHMRVGHANQVITPIGTQVARRHYEQALNLIQSCGVTRTTVEVCMGQALLYGHDGDLVAAEAVAREGLHIAESAGDEWIAAMIWLALGGAAVAANDKRALEWLEQANHRFTRGGDTYGQAVVALWRSLASLRHNDDTIVKEHTTTLLTFVQTYGYEGLLTNPTLFGPRDMAMIIPILLTGRSLSNTTHSTTAKQLLRQAFPTVASDDIVDEYHPGYTLRIQMLGTFRVWRGTTEIHSREWQREKARQLLQLLLTYRGQWIQREQICAWLWPDSDLDAAERQFKVTLNALNTALEPFRPPRTAPFFVRRQGLAYSFAPSYGCWIDVDEFELRTTNIPQSNSDFVLRNAQTAVNLYKGDYLAESLYDSWTLEERERLLARYLATTTALAHHLMEKDDMQQAVLMCEQVLRRDRCYEEAYQVLMCTYARSGSRSQALRSYDRCVHALQDDLGIDPLPETTQLYERMKRNEQV